MGRKLVMWQDNSGDDWTPPNDERNARTKRLERSIAWVYLRAILDRAIGLRYRHTAHISRFVPQE